ncbi:DUF2971 domain-containing protein [Planctomycetota bacterium]
MKRDYEREWRKAGYPRGMGSAKFLPPPDRNSLRAYHLTSAEHGISSIILRRLKVARFSDVNDPFELMPLNAHKRAIRRLLRDFSVSQNSKMGLLCFSKNWTDPLLWSHYASKHEGICLGFDLTPGSEVQDVVYINERLPVDFSTDEDAQSITTELKNQLLRTKYDGWKYEQEIRRFVNLSKTRHENGLYFLPFNRDLRLREVILGARSSFRLRAIRAIVRLTNPEAVVFKTRLERRGFRIVGDGRYKPDIPTDTA